VRRHELAIEQRVAPQPQARDKPGHGDFRSIRGAAEHALAKEGPAENQPIKPADELTIRASAGPALDTVGKAAMVQAIEGFLDIAIDPGGRAVFRALRT
jgi:hypothetical protein